MNIAFMSHLDRNLYHFRLPIMLELIKNGCKVYAIVPKGSFCHMLESHGVNMIYYDIDRGGLNPVADIQTIYNVYSRIKNINLDILHAFTIKPNIYAVIAGRLAGVTDIICTVTGLGSYYISNTIKSRLVRFFIELLYKIAFKYSTKVIFQNNDDLQQYVDSNIITHNKAVLIRSSGVDTELFCIEKISESDIESLKNELNIKNGELVVLMVARALLHKGTLDYLIVSNNFKNENIRFLYVGMTDKGNPSSLSEDTMNSYNVDWLKYRNDVATLIAICDIFVLPSYREGVPRTLLEAGSMSKPIITTNAVGCREVVDENINGFKVDIGDINTFTNKIYTLVNNKYLRSMFGKNSRAKIVEEFDIGYVVSQYMELYDMISKNRSMKN